MKFVVNMELDAAVVQWMRRFPEISRDEALADLFNRGWRCNETYAALMRLEKAALDVEHGVIDSPDEFRGWHLAWSKPRKPGVLHGELTRQIAGGYELRHFFCSVDCLRVARELGLIARSDGFMISA